MSILEKYQWLSSCAGIELNILPDSTISCRICEISLQKNALSIDNKSEVKGDLPGILKKLNFAKPVSLSITGKGVLSKKTSKVEELSDDKLLRVFPNIRPEQFYIQNFISGEFSYISIVRKEVLDEILRALGKAEVNVLLVNLGPFASSHILKQLNFYGKEIRFDGHIISLSAKDDWDDYQYTAFAGSEFPLKIDIEAIAEQFLLAYAAAFQLALYHQLNPVELPVDTIKNSLYNFEQKQKFNFRLVVTLAVFFILLLSNFLLFSYYSSKNNVLQTQVSESAASVETLVNTEDDIAKKEKVLRELGWYKGISHAWLADQLAQSLPTGISLKEISINPLNILESNRQRKEIYKIGTIEISGEAIDMEPVNEWIYALKNKSWPYRVNLDSFSPSTENDKQYFAVTINY